ncbi:hypothetical protein GGR58DRAFT_351144 [Xylaria digitata]|nr:hypothetical protein GGR58DRAFT_351144 [Xylaria digitata]
MFISYTRAMRALYRLCERSDLRIAHSAIGRSSAVGNKCYLLWHFSVISLLILGWVNGRQSCLVRITSHVIDRLMILIPLWTILLTISSDYIVVYMLFSATCRERYIVKLEVTHQGFKEQVTASSGAMIITPYLYWVHYHMVDGS